MTRMLGRTNVRGLSLNCAMRDGRYCRDCGWDGRMGTRSAKRLEARELAAEIDGELHPEPDLEHLATLGPLYDLSDCEHGCNGSPSCGERCNFTCHPGPERAIFGAMSRTVHVPYVVEQDEGGVWCASAQLRPGVGAVGEGPTREAAVEDLRSGLTLLIEEVGAPDELEITVGA